MDALSNDSDMMQLIVDYWVDVTVGDANGMTVFHILTRSSSVEMTKFLPESCADINT